MPVGLGLAVSHAPGLYVRSEEEWDGLWHRLSLDRGIPQPARVAQETGAQLKSMVQRIEAAHDEMTRVYEEYHPDILIVLGGDQIEMFDRSNVPQLMFYLGETAWGSVPGARSQRPDGADVEKVEMEVDVEFSRWLLHRLVKEEGFDISFSDEMGCFGDRPGLGKRYGLPHAFVNPTSVICQNYLPKTVLVYENTYDPPSLSANRCYEFGQALARVLKNDKRRIAVLASGGLSHDPGGKRSGWVDVPMDRWFLDQLANGRGKATTSMFSFDSDTMVGGTGENRPWITVAGAMEEMGCQGATVLDYVEAGKTVTGLGFVYWTLNN